MYAPDANYIYPACHISFLRRQFLQDPEPCFLAKPLMMHTTSAILFKSEIATATNIRCGQCLHCFTDVLQVVQSAVGLPGCAPQWEAMLTFTEKKL